VDASGTSANKGLAGWQPSWSSTEADALPRSLTWMWAWFGFLWVLSLRTSVSHWILVRGLSRFLGPFCRSARKRLPCFIKPARKNQSATKMEVSVFCNLLLGGTLQHRAAFYSLGASHKVQSHSGEESMQRPSKRWRWFLGHFRGCLPQFLRVDFDKAPNSIYDYWSNQFYTTSLTILVIHCFLENNFI
jgi:hypothetical protein